LFELIYVHTSVPFLVQRYLYEFDNFFFTFIFFIVFVQKLQGTTDMKNLIKVIALFIILNFLTLHSVSAQQADIDKKTKELLTSVFEGNHTGKTDWVINDSELKRLAMTCALRTLQNTEQGECSSFEDKKSELLVVINDAVKEGHKLWGNRDYSGASNSWMPAAMKGHVDAEFMLGWYYISGASGSKQPVKALKWFRSAAEKNYSSAQHELGKMYTYSEGVNQDLEKGANLQMLSAKQGYARAYAELAYLHEMGYGVPKDLPESIRYLKLAADKNLTRAMIELAELYLNGQGVEQDFNEAVRYLTLAADKNNVRAMNKLAELYLNGQGVEQDSNEAMKWFEVASKKARSKSASNNAKFQIALMHLKGQGIPVNIEEAVDRMLLLADQKYVPAISKLGEFYLKGLGVQQNTETAIKWFELGVKENDPVSQYFLGSMYQNNQVDGFHMRDAVELYKLSAAQDYQKAQLALGRYYFEEEIFYKAFEMYLPASQKGIREAETAVGSIYIFDGVFVEGKGIRRFPKTGSILLTSAAEKGSPLAALYLGSLYLNGVTHKSDEDEKIEQNVELALRWYTFSALKGDGNDVASQGNDVASGNAAERLAVMYREGVIVPQNLEESIRWSNIAIQKGNADAIAFSESQAAEKKSKKEKKIVELLSENIRGKKRIIRDENLVQLATKCVEGDQNSCELLTDKKPVAIVALREELKKTIDCRVQNLIGEAFGDYYSAYENEDWSSEKDTKYNITINHKWTVTYPAQYPIGSNVNTQLGDAGKEDMVGTFEKTAIVPYTKSGSKFIPDFSQHWSSIQLIEMPKIMEVMYAAGIVNDGDFLLQKSECTIENIVEKK
jgi:uncharacterized protein